MFYIIRIEDDRESGIALGYETGYLSEGEEAPEGSKTFETYEELLKAAAEIDAEVQKLIDIQEAAPEIEDPEEPIVIEVPEIPGTKKTTKELKALLAKHDVEGRSKLKDNGSRIAALKKAGVEV